MDDAYVPIPVYVFFSFNQQEHAYMQSASYGLLI